jgi:hypothetical protein
MWSVVFQLSWNPVSLHFVDMLIEIWWSILIFFTHSVRLNFFYAASTCNFLRSSHTFNFGADKFFSGVGFYWVLETEWKWVVDEHWGDLSRWCCSKSLDLLLAIANCRRSNVAGLTCCRLGAMHSLHSQGEAAFVRISSGTVAYLTEVSRNFSQPLQTSFGIANLLNYNRFFPNTLHIHCP